jgi:hypothetical protein
MDYNSVPTNKNGGSRVLMIVILVCVLMMCLSSIVGGVYAYYYESSKEDSPSPAGDNKEEDSPSPVNCELDWSEASWAPCTEDSSCPKRFTKNARFEYRTATIKPAKHGGRACSDNVVYRPVNNPPGDNTTVSPPSNNNPPGDNNTVLPPSNNNPPGDNTTVLPPSNNNPPGDNTTVLPPSNDPPSLPVGDDGTRITNYEAYLTNLNISRANQIINLNTYSPAPNDLYRLEVNGATKTALRTPTQTFATSSDPYSQYCKLKSGIMNTQGLVEGPLYDEMLQRCGDEAVALNWLSRVQLMNYLNR